MTATPFSLTALRLRFECEAQTSLRLGGLKAGSNLRGALLNVMRRATCAAYPRSALGAAAGADPEHAKTCPVCWLVAANQNPGEERRGYTLAMPPTETIAPGERFWFELTLFGDAIASLPYFVLAAPEAGRLGMGVGRGTFALRSIAALHPAQEPETVLEEGSHIVHPPQGRIGHGDILRAAQTRWAGELSHLLIRFHTPLRVVQGEQLLKSPDFGAFFAALLRRVDDLAAQHCQQEARPAAERERLWALANRVRLQESDAEWLEVQSGSSRSGKATWISGLVGDARYFAPPEVWRELLPWLLWGEVAQVGKDTVKGNGVFRMMNAE